MGVRASPHSVRKMGTAVEDRTHPMFRASTVLFKVFDREVAGSHRYLPGCTLDGWYFYVRGCPHRLVVSGTSVTNHVLNSKDVSATAIEAWFVGLIQRHLEHCDLED